MIRPGVRRTGLETWERFWFQGVPPHTYAILRILFGVLGFVSLLGLTPVSMFWTLNGLAPVPGGGVGIRAQLLELGLGTVTGWVFFAALLGSFASMAVGYRSGAAVLCCFIGSVLQTFWNHLPLSSAHQVVVTVLFCLVWADTGAVWSVDAWLAARRGAATPVVNQLFQPVWPLRLLRFQIALIYLNSGLWKLFGEPWRDGSAVYYAVSQNIFHRFPLGVPPGMEWTTTIATYLTLAWEICFPLMLFHRSTRRAALLVGMFLHLGMWASLELGPFSWVMIGTYVAFLDPSSVSQWHWAWRRGRVTGTPAKEPIVIGRSARLS